MEQSLESFSTWFRELYHLDKPDVREYSALTLAYIGMQFMRSLSDLILWAKAMRR
ncbi:MAG: hypothetical protein ACLUI7_09155 [Coprococcus sp.]